MQYVGKVGGYVYNQWNAINPATLLGAIDIIVIERPDGSLHCSPWHIRFGKFQIIRPLQKKIDLYVNDIKTDLPMKLGEGGEACFVFETADHNLVSKSVLTSPVISPSSSAEVSPLNSPVGSPESFSLDSNNAEPEALDLNEHGSRLNDDIENKIKLTDSNPLSAGSPSKSPTPSSTLHPKIAFEKARKITQQLNIPSKIDINGDMVLDMDGYKPNSQKNIEVSDEYFKKIFLQELMELTKNNKVGEDMDHDYNFLDQIISKDKNGNIRILNNNLNDPDDVSLTDDLTNHEGLMRVSSNDESPLETAVTNDENKQPADKTYFKTLRLTSDQLQKMNLHYGENKLKFKLSQANSQIESNLYLWKSSTPIVISDIDGTITKSDALGHVLNLIGRDWTHPGVANLFQDIKSNGYNIIYLTARSVGQADSTRQYLKGIMQDGTKLPHGPVILSPDRTMAALKREVILKKPEVFKMSCLNDIASLYFSNSDDLPDDDDRTPFYAGFGNRITDAISYRSVKIPSHRIFTINPNGEVHMELLELAGYKSSYLHIGELVDHFFPPIKAVNTLNAYWNANQFNQYISNTQVYSSPGSPGARSIDNFDEDSMLAIKTDEKYNDVNYWREPISNLSDLSELDDENQTNTPEGPRSKSPVSPKLLSLGSKNGPRTISNVERPKSASSFTSPLKNFMFNHHDVSPSPTTLSSNFDRSVNDTATTNDSDYTNDYDDDDDDDYTDDGYDDDEDDFEDDYEDDEDVEDAVEDLDNLVEEELDDEDLDHDLGHNHVTDSSLPLSPKLSPVPPVLDPLKKSNTSKNFKNESNEESNNQFVKASELMDKMSL